MASCVSMLLHFVTTHLLPQFSLTTIHNSAPVGLMHRNSAGMP